MVSLLKIIKDHWQLMATSLIAWSLFDLYNFYSPFGVQILSYLSLGEVLLLVYPTILNGLLALLLIFFFFVIGLRKPSKHDKLLNEVNDGMFDFKFLWNEIKSNYKVKTRSNLFNLLFSVIGILMAVGSIVFCISIGVLVLSLFFYNYNFPFLIGHLKWGMLSFFSFFFLGPTFLLADKYFEKAAHPIFSRLTTYNFPILFFILGFVINSIISNRMQYLSITSGYGAIEVSFDWQDSKIKTDSNLIYIGETQQYFFLLDSPNNQSCAFKKSDALNLRLKKSPSKRVHSN